MKRHDLRALVRLAWIAVALLLCAIVLQVFLLYEVQKLKDWHIHVSAGLGVKTIDKPPEGDSDATDARRAKEDSQQ